MISRILTISRPRFWSYLAGPYLVGFAMSAPDRAAFLSIPFLYTLFFFLLPANFFVYGINDYFDRFADRVNPKEKTHESRITSADSELIMQYLLFSVLFALPLFIYLDQYAIGILISFMALAVFYSAPPVRFKSMKWLDSVSNLFYILPGVLGYAQNTPVPVTFSTLAYLACWPAAMHLFSAIPDIAPDQKAGLTTTATALGRTGSLVLCFSLWLVFAAYVTSVNLAYVFSFIYPSIALYLIYHTEKSVDSVYWKFPWLNGILGAALFIYTYFDRFHL